MRTALGQRFPAPTELLGALLSAALFPQVAYLHAPMTKKGGCPPEMVRLHIKEPSGESSEPQVCKSRGLKAL